MPTTSTVRAGALLRVGAAGWAIGIVTMAFTSYIEQGRSWEGLPQTLYMIGTVAMLAGGVLVFTGARGLLERHGGADRTALAGVALLGLGGIASAMAWFVLGWVVPIAIGAALLVTRLRAFAVAPRAPGVLMLAGAVAAALVAFVGASLDAFDGSDGTQLLMWSLLAAGQLVYAAGLAQFGDWMANEVPADDADHGLVA